MNKRLFIAALVIAVMSAFSFGIMADTAASVRVQRAAPDTIRAKSRAILSSTQFKERKNFREWLAEKFSRWHFNFSPSASGFGKFLFWFVFIWCVLALLAILGHLVWKLIVLLMNMNSHGRRSMAGTLSAIQPRSWQEVRVGSLTCASAGQYREAIKLLMAALLARMNDAGLLRMHPSKTNGDYFRECSAPIEARRIFQTFINSFERLIYGERQCDKNDFSQLNIQWEQMGQYVKKP